MNASELLPFLLLSAAPLWAQQPGTLVRMQWVVQQPGGKTGSKEEEFSKQSMPGPGKELHVYVLCSRDCIVSFAGFTRDGQLLYGLPETVQLKANVTKELPISARWTFDGHEQVAEMDAVMADPASAEYKSYSELIAAMSRPGASIELRQARAGAVREWIDGQLRSKTNAQDYSIKETPAEAAGLIRGDFHGQTMVVPPQKTSVVRLRIQ